MAIFDKLPVVKKCGCRVNLKFGSIFIAVWGVIHGAIDILFFVTTKTTTSVDDWKTVLEIAAYMCSAATGLFIISCIAFFIGIFLHSKITAVIFLYCKLLCLLAYMLLLSICIQVYLSGKEHSVQIFLLLLLIDIIIWAPFLLVVRSYKDTMERPRRK